MKYYTHRIMLVLFIFFSLSFTLQAQEYVKWNLPQSQQNDAEFLLYKLSFSGFLSAFIWKDLADVVLLSEVDVKQFNGHKTCQFHLKVSTENYSIAEVFSALRFHWRTQMGQDMMHLYMSEKINEGRKDRREVFFLDDKNNVIHSFRKRQKIIINPDRNIFSEDDDIEAIYEWEKNGKVLLSDFIKDTLQLSNGMAYYVHKRSTEIEADLFYLDPLMVIHYARWSDFEKSASINVFFDGKMRTYELSNMGEGDVKIHNQTIAAVEIRIMHSADEGYMTIWFSNDDRRLPLKFIVEGGYGSIKLEMDESLLNNKPQKTSCMNLQVKTQNR